MSSRPQVDCLVAAGLESQVILPDDARYAARVESYFDNGSRLHPACFVQPRTAVETAKAVQALAAARQPFAVRSGGCTIGAQGNNIDGGVTVDLAHLNHVECHPQTRKVDIGPGAIWSQVYDELDRHGQIVGGGRAGSVGVGGYLLGGGLSFLSGRHGFTCDSVVAYEVALADGTVVTADSEQRADLFRALKGGSNNFGIVTRFTMETYPSQHGFWGGVNVKKIDFEPEASQAVQDFTSNAAKDPDSTLLHVATYQPLFGGNVLLTASFNAAGVERPKAFDKFMALPDLVTRVASGKVQELLPFCELPLDNYNIWYTLTVKNDASIISKASELIFQVSNGLKDRIPSDDFRTHCAFQPIPRLYTERSLESGGNVMGLDQYPHDAVLLQVSAGVKTAELAEWVRPRLEAIVEQVRAFAGPDRLCPWLYLNYAHRGQKVLESYGPDNVGKLKAVAAKYDPTGVFQRLCAGGFKLPV